MNRIHTPAARTGRAAVAGGCAASVERLENRRLMSVVFALQARNTLIAFDSASPDTVIATVRVKGLARGETLRGIDFRPSNDRLYALGSTDRLYTIDTAAGTATPVSAATLGVPLDTGQEVGLDFNPTSDVLRVVTESSQNLRVAPDAGTAIDADAGAEGVQFDGLLTYDASDPGAGVFADALGAAYTNNDIDPATPTTLFGIDAARDVLFRQGSPDASPISPNSGALFTVGSLGIDALPVGGFDVTFDGAGGNTALAALSTSERAASQLYTINLTTGGATAVGNIGRGRRPVLALAVAPEGTPFFVTTARNELLGLNTATPGLVLSRTRITGLASRRERVVGIDVQPSSGDLFALTDGELLYRVNPASGAATSVGSASAVALTDRASFGFDFNPAADLIRVTNSAGQNLRVNPGTGSVLDFDVADADIDPDTGLAYVPGDSGASTTPRIVGSAYSNNVAGAIATTLYALDAAREALVTQGNLNGTPTPPNTGQLFTVGATGVNVPDQAGFDIVTAGGSDSAFAVFAPGGRGAAQLFSVNLASGAMTALSSLNRRVKGITGFALRI